MRASASTCSRRRWLLPALPRPLQSIGAWSTGDSRTCSTGDRPFPSDARGGGDHRSPHLTFARRAFELADWYRARGAKVVFGGLHVLSCPDECAPHADALALGDGVQLWPRILRDIEANTLQSRYLATYENDYREDPSPRRSLLPRRSFLTTTSLIATRGCHNRCGFCYLATDGLRIPYRMRHPRQVVEEFKADHQPYAVFIDEQPGITPRLLAFSLRRVAPAQQNLERCRYDRCHRRPRFDPKHGVGGMHRRIRRLRIALR